MSQHRAMPRPMCLVKNACGSLQVCEDAVRFLSGINGPVVVVSIVGLYRTGKSYLMNRLTGQQSGFALGNTVESKTKGIWMWCVPHPRKEGHTLVLLDTEGLGDVDKGNSQNDGWIFCLAVLLSSTLVYNSRGTIENDALEQLHYITELTERIKVRSPLAVKEDEVEEDTEDSTQFVRFFPSFIWAVRDFTLKLEIKGQKATEDEYLNFALELQKGVGKKFSDYNLPRECIRNYFPSRKCFVFPSPASPENMRCLESLQEQDLVPAFQEVTGRFCDYIFNESDVKTLKGGHRVTGKLLGRLAQIYVETISSGKVPCLDNAVITLAHLENQAAVEAAFKVYQDGMEEVKNTFPVNGTDFTSAHQRFSSLATSEFMKRSFKDDKAEYLKKLKETIDSYCIDLMRKNEKASEEKCRDLLKDLFSDMSERLQSGEYSQCGGYEVYCRHRDAIVAQYRSEPNKGVRAEAVLNEFLRGKEAEANSILRADKQLEEDDRKFREEKEREVLLKQKCREEEEKLTECKRMMEAEKQRQEDNRRQFEEKFNKEIDQNLEEMNRALESKMKSLEELLSNKLKEKADLLEEEIKTLKDLENKVKEKKSEDWFKENVIPVFTIIAGLIPSFLQHELDMIKLSLNK